jgi:hypothetical protein
MANKNLHKEYPEIMNLKEFMEFLRVGYKAAMEILEEIPHQHRKWEWRICKQDVIDWVRTGKNVKSA